mmetsp:Transcript_25791/g.78402  ORF Transcript_25791/g.78402 Transcript_25791/m.78402 type:complete len:258 (+) Transcript_25791:1126-1899(+)
MARRTVNTLTSRGSRAAPGRRTTSARAASFFLFPAAMAYAVRLPRQHAIDATRVPRRSRRSQVGGRRGALGRGLGRAARRPRERGDDGPAFRKTAAGEDGALLRRRLRRLPDAERRGRRDAGLPRRGAGRFSGHARAGAARRHLEEYRIRHEHAGDARRYCRLFSGIVAGVLRRARDVGRDGSVGNSFVRPLFIDKQSREELVYSGRLREDDPAHGPGRHHAVIAAPVPGFRSLAGLPLLDREHVIADVSLLFFSDH